MEVFQEAYPFKPRSEEGIERSWFEDIVASLDFTTFATTIVLLVISVLVVKLYRNRQKTIDKFKLFFNDIRFYKLFIVLQIFFIFILLIYDVANSEWDLIISYCASCGNFPIELHASLFDGYSSSTTGNLLAIATIFLPIFISKSIDWVLNKNE